MSDDGNIDDRLRRLQAEMRANRRRMLTELTDEFRGLAERLAETYSRVELIILDRLKNLSAGDNPALLMERLADVQGDFEILTRQLMESEDVFASGARAGVKVGVQNLRAGGMRGALWGVTDADTILAGISMVDSTAYADMINKYAPYHVQRIKDVVLDAISRGKNPRESAQLLARYLETKAPLNDALRITRTSQLYALRKGTQLSYIGNDITRWMWSANIGSPRTCLACIAMHGTIHPTTEMLNDHWLGRCSPLPITPTWAELGLDGMVEYKPVSGVTWFYNQSADVQARAMGSELFELFQRGAFEFTPANIVKTQNHPVFGDMRVRKPNYEIIGTSTVQMKRLVLNFLRRDSRL